MAGLNRVTLIGHLGKDPELNYLEGNITVAKFSLATTESYKDKAGNRIDNTEWHNIVLWRGQADNAGKYLKKGSLIFLEGRIKSRSWTDKENVKRYATDIVGERFMMLDRKEGGSVSHAAPNSEMASAPVTTPDEAGGDDLPF